MADYKELLRRAISALPENNGAARRAVYEKARAALVAQLRAITPPLPAREITQHRLQLEDCIRQVEHEASEAVITLGRDSLAQNSTPAPEPTPSSTTFTAPAPPSSPPPFVPREESKPAPFVPPPAAEKPEPKAEPKPEPVEAKPEPEASLVEEPEAEAPKPATPVAPVEAKPASRMSIEDIISQAAASGNTEVEKTTPVTPVAPVTPLSPRPAVPVADKPAPQIIGVTPRPATPAPAPLKGPVFAPRRDMAPAANAAPALSTGRIEPSISGAALAHKPDLEAAAIAEVAPVEPALSSVREVEVETEDGTREAEGAIERAIETLDREARGEATEALPERASTRRNLDSIDDGGFATADAPPRSGPGLTIFLVVFVLLLSAVGGAGYWAWREDYLPLDQMFGRATPPVVQTQNTETPATPSMDSPSSLPETAANGTAGPGNTATTTTGEPTTALEGMEIEDRLEPTPEPVTPTGNETVLPSISNGEVKTEERLSSEETSIAAEDPTASVDPAVLAGSQSLLLEASTNGSTGAVPFSGTVDWTEGQDEIGLPTLIAKASIPARNLGVTVTIRKNSDPVLPASHLMEVNFDVSDTFVGGSITSLPGVLLKDEELVPGAPLVGASARIVGNSFLFALSASPQDATTNRGLLETRRWMDLAVVYGTGRNAILTLEKDDEAQALFEKVFAAWAE